MNPLIEPLEGRRMMSTTLPAIDVSLAPDGTLTINNATSVTVQEFLGNGTTIPTSVVVTSPQIGAGGFNGSGTYLGVTKIFITGTDGQDIISLNDTDIKASVNTLKGSDQIFLSGSGQTTIASDDSATIVIDAGGGKDLISVVDTTVYVASSTGHDFVYSDGVLV